MPARRLTPLGYETPAPPKPPEVWEATGGPIPRRSALLLAWLAALVLAVALLATFAPWRRKTDLSSPHAKAQGQLRVFGAALEAFQQDVGRYPNADEGLDALFQRPIGLRRWTGPYLPGRLPLDPWGRRYAYRCPAPDGKAVFTIRSWGPDRSQDTADDLTVSGPDDP